MQTKTRRLVTMSTLCALSIVLLMLVRFPIIPGASFLEYEPADVPILIGTFIYGPMAGLLMTAVVSIIQGATVSAASGWVGIAMHFIATGIFVIVAGNIYKKIHNIKGALIALLLGSLAMVLIMIPSNLFFTVKFYGYPYEAVKALLVPAIIPFNAIKALANSIIVLVVYKPLVRFIRHEEILEKRPA